MVNKINIIGGFTNLLTKIVQTWTGSNNMIQVFNLGTSGHHITWMLKGLHIHIAKNFRTFPKIQVVRTSVPVLST